MHLQFAALYYGTTKPYEVKADDVRELPIEFDFRHPEQCARKVLAAMSLASGGHPLRECHALVYTEGHRVTISASGAIVRYAPRGEQRQLTAEQAIEILNKTARLDLGTVYPPGRSARR